MEDEKKDAREMRVEEVKSIRSYAAQTDQPTETEQPAAAADQEQPTADEQAQKQQQYQVDVLDFVDTLIERQATFEKEQRGRAKINGRRLDVIEKLLGLKARDITKLEATDEKIAELQKVTVLQQVGLQELNRVVEGHQKVIEAATGYYRKQSAGDPAKN
jgi:hypothetical protein